MAFSLTPKLGIDLGTTTVLVFAPGRGIVLHEPSVVAVPQQENRILAVGNEAKEMIGRTPDTITAYRPMKDGVIADYRIGFFAFVFQVLVNDADDGAGKNFA